jgi:hypothetical protein
MEKEATTAANMFNYQSQTADKCDPPDIGWRRNNKCMLYKSSMTEFQRGKMRYKNLHDFICSSTVNFSSLQLKEDEMDGALCTH